MWIVAAIILAVLAGAVMLNSVSIQRGTSIAGKTFSKSVTVTGSQVQAVEATVTAATAGTMTAQAQSSKTVSTVSWSAGVATFTTTASHGYTIGQVVVVASVTPSGYNGNFVVATVPSTTTFTVALGVNPGAYVSGGTITSYHTFTCTTTNPFLATNRLDIYSGTTTIACLRGVTAQVVVGLAVGFNGGSGSVPSNTTAVQVNIPTNLKLAFTGNSLQAYALTCEAVGNFQFIASDDSTETVNETPQQAAYVKVWDVYGPTTNPFAGLTNGSVYVSHNDTTGSKVSRIGTVVT